MVADRWRIKVEGLGAVELTAKGSGLFGLVTGLCRSEPGRTDTEFGMDRCACPAPLRTLRGAAGLGSGQSWRFGCLLKGLASMSVQSLQACGSCSHHGFNINSIVVLIAGWCARWCIYGHDGLLALTKLCVQRLLAADIPANRRAGVFS
jgi:hypothetical protein